MTLHSVKVVFYFQAVVQNAENKKVAPLKDAKIVIKIVDSF